MYIVFIMLVNVSFYLPALYIISECNDKAWPTQRCDLPVFFCNFDPVQLIFQKIQSKKCQKVSKVWRHSKNTVTVIYQLTNAICNILITCKTRQLIRKNM